MVLAEAALTAGMTACWAGLFWLQVMVALGKSTHPPDGRVCTWPQVLPWQEQAEGRESML